jgi:hypothetical protein
VAPLSRQKGSSSAKVKYSVWTTPTDTPPVLVLVLVAGLLVAVVWLMGMSAIQG